MRKNELKSNRPIIETYKGFEISVDTNTSRFFATNKGLNLELERESIWELKHSIDETKWESPKDKQAIIIWPTYDDDRLAKVTILKQNSATKVFEFIIDEQTDINVSDVGDTKTENHIKLYPLNENNLRIWGELCDIEKQIAILESKQSPLVKKLTLK